MRLNTGQPTEDKRIHVKLDMNLLDPEIMRNEVSFEGAIGLLESHLVNPAIDTQRLLEDILDIPYLFELFVHAMSEASYNMLLSWLLDTFPSTAADYCASLGCRLLQELSTYCGSLQVPALDQSQRDVALAHPVVAALAIICRMEDLEDPESPQAIRQSKRPSQKQAKKARRAQKKPSTDEGPFLRFGIRAAPQSREDALDLSRQILDGQRFILVTYLNVLRASEHAEHVRLCYIPTMIPEQVQAAAKEAHVPAPVEDTFTTVEVEPGRPSAYPAVQPLRAALYFDSPDGFGPWRLVVPQRAEKDLRDTRKKDPKLFDIIIKKLKELSLGHFSADNQKRLIGSDSGLPIFEAKMTGDTRLVYRVDCQQEYDSNAVTQVLHIYGVYTHAQMHGRRFWDAVSRSSANGGREYRKRCIYRSSPRTPGSDVILPAVWLSGAVEEEDDDSDELGLQYPDLSADDKQELQNILRSDKVVPFSQAFLNGIISDKDINHPFYMSPQEQMIVKHPGSCFVYGRSGTGKTTTMVFKMIGIERMYRALKDDLDADTVAARPRQLFVTQSRSLAEKVEEYFKKMVLAVEVESNAMPQSPNVDRRRDGSAEFAMVDKDEEARYHSSLPKKFSDLTQDHFPLFLTTEQLYRLLAADFNQLVNEQEGSRKGRPFQRDTDTQNQESLRRVPENLISYRTFLKSFWRKFPYGLTKGLEPSSVYSEFIGTIKGSELALKSGNGVLDRQSYEALSDRVTAFGVNRGTVYSLFESYVKAKKRAGQADAADRTHALIQNLLQHGIPGKKVDYIYIDEVQDNLLVDTFILRFICKRPDGVFWAGDTAQTISAGSSFRFNELKAFMYRLEKGSKASNSETFQLTKNYRSHGGIVKCANTIVRLISRFWPYTIDSLKEEKGLMDGLKPTFFSGGSGATPQFDEFLSDDSGCAIEFGAKQCIIVRDPEEVKRLYEELGDIGIIMTLDDTKGLEFEDVVLYNFFADSTVGASQWRLVLAEADGMSIHHPTFDEIKHHGLCRELKSLYVAATRARLNLWIIDYSEKGEPMRLLWQHRNEISTWVPGSPVPRLAAASSRAEWASAAQKYFSNKNYLQAIHAYQRAGMVHERSIAEAYYLRDLAEEQESPNSSGDSNAFVKAAWAFQEIAELVENVQTKQAYHRICAECFVRAGDDSRAAYFFECAAAYDLSATHYRAAGSFDDAVRLAKTHEHEMESEVVENIVDISKLYYLKSGEISKAEELFDSVEEAANFTDLYGLDVARARLYESHHLHAKAAEVHIQLGQIDEAIRLFLKAGETDSSNVHRAYECILDEFWKIMPLGVRPPSDDAHVRGLLDLSALVIQHELSSEEKDQLAMFAAITSGNIQDLKNLGRRFAPGNAPCTVLCFDHVFSTDTVPAEFKSSDPDKLGHVLQLFSLYTQALRSLAYSRHACDGIGTQRLLKFSAVAEFELYTVQPGSILAEELVRVQYCGDLPSQGVQVPVLAMERVVRNFLQRRLLDRVRAENDACRSSSVWLQPCVYFAIENRCRSREEEHCTRLHVAWNDLPQHQGQLSSLVLRQMQIYEDASGAERWMERWGQHRWWLLCLYRSWQPLFGKLTTMAEPATDCSVAKKWLYGTFFDHAPYLASESMPEGFLTGLIRYFTLYRVAARSDSPPYARRLPCITGPFPVWILRHHERDGVHLTRDLLGFFAGDPKGILACTRLLRHIAIRKLPIDASVLCDFLDLISATLVVAYRAHRPAHIHGTVLPRTWLLSVAGLLCDPSASTKPFGSIADYVTSVAMILGRLYTGSETEHLFPSTSSRPAYLTRSIYITRICQNLALVGYNIEEVEIKDTIRHALRHLGTSLEQPEPHWLYQRLSTAIHWELIMDIVRKNSFELAVGDVVQLVERRKVSGMPPPPGRLRRVIYSLPDEIPALLLPGIAADPSLRATVTPSRVGEPVPVVKTISKVATDAPIHSEALFEDREAGFDAPVGNSGNIAEDDDTLADLPAHTDEHLAIVRNVVDIYLDRRQRRRLNTVLLNDLDFRRTRHFTAFLARSGHMSWSGTLRNFYRKLYLGPVPHIMVSLDCAVDHLRSQKGKETMRLSDKKGDHRELDAIRAEVKRWNELCCTADAFMALLGPESEIHRDADRQRLEQCLSDAQQFLHAIPSNSSDLWCEDLAIAVKGILMRAPENMRVVPPKPELQVEVESDYSYMYD